jgi:tRNA(Arg) A34 adenosine deaminase TadA
VLSEAIRYAKENPTDLNKMAAIISKRKRVLGIGFNSRKTHPLQRRFSDHDLKVCIHAEIDALRDALRNYDEEAIRGAEIFVARVLKNGSPATAKPCKTCQVALDTFGIAAVYWTEHEIDSNSI